MYYIYMPTEKNESFKNIHRNRYNKYAKKSRIILDEIRKRKLQKNSINEWLNKNLQNNNEI